MYGCGKDCLILIPFRLPQVSCFTLSLKCFSSDSDDSPDVGIRPLLQLPNPPRASPVLLTLLLFPPSSFVILSFAWFCIFFPIAQILLSVLIWCSACTSVSDSVFLMYLWREIYSTSTYSSAILFSPCPILYDPMHCCTPGFPVHHQLLELTQTHVHRVSDTIQPSHPLSSPSPPAFNLSQHQSFLMPSI